MRNATLAAMAAVVFGTALAVTLKLWDADLAVKTGDPVPGVFFLWIGDVRAPWVNADRAPLGSVMVGGDAEDTMNAYIPLLGFVWWFGPASLALFLAAGLALVRYSRRSTGPTSYLTSQMLAGCAAVALLGALAAIPFASSAFL